MNPDKKLQGLETKICQLKDNVMAAQESFREYAVNIVRLGGLGLTVSNATTKNIPAEVELAHVLNSTMKSQQETALTFYKKFDLILEAFECFNNRCLVVSAKAREVRIAERSLERSMNNLSILYNNKSKLGSEWKKDQEAKLLCAQAELTFSTSLCDSLLMELEKCVAVLCEERTQCLRSCTMQLTALQLFYLHESSSLLEPLSAFILPRSSMLGSDFAFVSVKMQNAQRAIKRQEQESVVSKRDHQDEAKSDCESATRAERFQDGVRPQKYTCGGRPIGSRISCVTGLTSLFSDPRSEQEPCTESERELSRMVQNLMDESRVMRRIIAKKQAAERLHGRAMVAADAKALAQANEISRLQVELEAAAERQRDQAMDFERERNSFRNQIRHMQINEETLRASIAQLERENNRSGSEVDSESKGEDGDEDSDDGNPPEVEKRGRSKASRRSAPSRNEDYDRDSPESRSHSTLGDESVVAREDLAS